MKVFLVLALFVVAGLTGCVNQSIAARRSDIPWNQPNRSEATGALPASITNQYED
ncbi:MAG: hypothetical protein RR417_02185 [Kiritimatiellia bacterium]